MIKGSHHSEESKTKSRLAHLGKKASLKTRLKLSKAHEGYKYDEKGNVILNLEKSQCQAS